MSFDKFQVSGAHAAGTPALASPEGPRRYITTAQIDLLLRSARLVLLVEPAAAAILTLGLWMHVHSPQAVFWLAGVWGVAALRCVFWRRARGFGQGSDQFLEWGHAFAVATVAAGALWASALFFLWPDALLGHQVYLAAGVTGVASIVVFAIAGYPPAAYGYTIVVALIVSSGLIWQEAGNAVAAGVHPTNPRGLVN